MSYCNLGPYGTQLYFHDRVKALIRSRAEFAMCITETTTPPPPVTLVSAASRRAHGGAGSFDLPVPLSGTPAVEPRQNGGGAALVLTFGGPAVPQDGQLNCGQEVTVANGTCLGLSASGNQLIVNLDPVQNACVSVSLSGLAGLTGASIVRLVAQEGNITGDAGVNLMDLSMLKDQIFQPVTSAVFRLDLNCDGSINLMDLNAAKANLFATAPACP
jgi:hypothetical protein